LFVGVIGQAASENPTLAFGLLPSAAVSYPTRELQWCCYAIRYIHRNVKKSQRIETTTSLRHQTLFRAPPLQSPIPSRCPLGKTYVAAAARARIPGVPSPPPFSHPAAAASTRARIPVAASKPLFPSSKTQTPRNYNFVLPFALPCAVDAAGYFRYNTC
jgi:hypothetical protein